MWKLPPPDCSQVEEELVRAMTFVNGNRVYDYSDMQRQSLLETYADYVAKRGAPATSLLATALGIAFLQALHDAYDEVQEGGRLSSLRSALKIRVQKCPYCGFGEVRELDHHLPRSIYKALSIFPNNLVPCCSGCNNKKRAIAAGDPDQQFPHIYLEELPPGRFLLATPNVSEQGIVVRFSISQCVGMSDAVFSKVKFHFERLELGYRYQSEVISFLTSQRTSLQEMGALGADALRDYLWRTREHSVSDFGLNHWQTALLEGLSNCNEFLAGGYQSCFGLKIVGG
jgi:hypothetical protein